MVEPTRPSFKGIPEAPLDGYVIETGAAKGMRMHLAAKDLAGIRCHVCGGGAGVGTDGRLYIQHDSAKHFTLGGGSPSASAIMSQPIKREDEPKRSWWDSE